MVAVQPLQANTAMTQSTPAKPVIWFDIDNCLYGRSAMISEMMSDKIAAYFLRLGISQGGLGKEVSTRTHSSPQKKLQGYTKSITCDMV